MEDIINSSVIGRFHESMLVLLVITHNLFYELAKDILFVISDHDLLRVGHFFLVQCLNLGLNDAKISADFVKKGPLYWSYIVIFFNLV